MKSFLTDQRASGILAHLTSLPSPHGIGDMGVAASHFLDFLQEAGQRYYQFLPTGPTNPTFDNSPYMSSSAFAGSPLLISPEGLVKDKLLLQEDLSGPTFSDFLVNYDLVTTFKQSLLKRAFNAFTPAADYHHFIRQSEWLDDYALFMALKEKYAQSHWTDWPTKIARRDPATIASLHDTLKEQIDYYYFEQYIFFRQCRLFRQEAKKRKIKLIGDIPIYVSADSADVWANQKIFCLDSQTLHPTHVAGVPPDYFSETGQRWGNPLYQWQTTDPIIRKQLLSWWKQRFQHTFQLVDVARIDHFRGFADYWSIPADETTAINGKWLPGPGKGFFDTISAELGDLPIIAEDLGLITPEVIKLRDNLNFPGMKILQFGFDGDPNNPFLPHTYTTTNCVVYTGTHDNDTCLGWFLDETMNDAQRSRIKEYVNGHHHDLSPIHQDMIYLAMSSIGALAVHPLQDILGYGNDCKMNTPGTSHGNWRWRCPPHALTAEVARSLRKMSQLWGRIGDEK